MSKTGQARAAHSRAVRPPLARDSRASLPGKEHSTTALVQVSFKLGLRVQEIAFLQVKAVAELGPETSGDW